MDRFIVTTDKDYAEQLEKYGFKKLTEKNGMYTFANQPVTLFEDFSLDTTKCMFTNRIRF